MEIVWLGTHPGKEALHLRILAQAFHVVQATGNFGFAKAGVNGAVADLMQTDRALVGAALQLRGQMMTARTGVARNHPVAERAEYGSESLGLRRIGSA
ncbi:hypothetical protein ILT42_03635 [Microvirga sp. BT291]|nr:hypothetical protein [Microvirga pudoricolor]